MAESDVELGLKRTAGLEVLGEEDERDLNPVECHECGGRGISLNLKIAVIKEPSYKLLSYSLRLR